MTREPREQLLIDLLRDEWNTDNTFTLQPDISYGWYDEEKGTPQVTIPQPDEGPISGGDTGYSGITPDGTGPNQTISGTLDVSCWCAFDELDNASTEYPQEYLAGSADRTTGDVTLGVVEEIKRIVRENAVRPTNPKTSNQPVRVIAPGDGTQVEEPDTQGLFRYDIPISFVYSTS